MTIAAGSAALAADILAEHNSDGTHKSTTGSHITHAQLASGTGTTTHADLDTHYGASAAVHGLGASVNVLGEKQASGLRVEYKSATGSVAGSGAFTAINVTWDNAFSNVYGAGVHWVRANTNNTGAPYQMQTYANQGTLSTTGATAVFKNDGADAVNVTVYFMAIGN